jgi:hypothetical protein
MKMKPPDRVEGVLCEQCDTVCDHIFVLGSWNRYPDYIISWNGIKCLKCGHITVAWAEDYEVASIHADWLDGGMADAHLEDIWTSLAADLIRDATIEVNK